MSSAIEVQRAYVQAELVERVALVGLQENGGALLAAQTCKHALRTEVSVILAMARQRNGGGIDPVGAYRHEGYRARVDAIRQERCMDREHAASTAVDLEFHEGITPGRSSHCAM